MDQLEGTYQLSLFPHLLLESEFHGCLRLVFPLQNFICRSPQSDSTLRQIVVDSHISEPQFSVSLGYLVLLLAVILYFSINHCFKMATSISVCADMWAVSCV